jgi:hypothetical protein
MFSIDKQFSKTHLSADDLKKSINCTARGTSATDYQTVSIIDQT